VKLAQLIGIVALAAVALGVVFEFLVPSSARIIDAAALVFAVATWIVPAPMRYARKPKHRWAQSAA
jgi:hypothetical protein